VRVRVCACASVGGWVGVGVGVWGHPKGVVLKGDRPTSPQEDHAEKTNVPPCTS
jgi:hypothetical protein